MKYPIGIQNFPKLRNGGFAYVDKTDLIYELTHTFVACFLSRPRRFGKSLLLSTMEAYFKGERELFKGLKIEHLEKEWAKHPVIHIDLNNGYYKSGGDLEQTLKEEIESQEELFGVKRTKETIGGRFADIIKKAYRDYGQGVVVLIDEYDKPMLEIMSDEEAQEEYRDILKPFYGTLKKCDGCLSFVFLTGVTKFARLSVFSDLNQIKDISLLPEYETLCGVTTKEMLDCFQDGVEEFAKHLNISCAEMIHKLEQKYDGYHFSERLIGVLNPFSLLNSLRDKKLDDFWFQTGTPTFLTRLLKKHHTDLSQLEGYRAKGSLLTSVESMEIDPVPIIYQSGYLTIKDYEKSLETYILGYPNEEVKQGFFGYLLKHFAKMTTQAADSEIQHLVEDLRKGEIQTFLTRLQSILSDFNYDLILDCEAHFQNILYIIFYLIGLKVDVEKRLSNGRIDMVVKTAHYIYVMEFKYNRSAQEAMDQIINTGDYLPYRRDHRTVYLLGINFSQETRNLSSDWLFKKDIKIS